MKTLDSPLEAESIPGEFAPKEEDSSNRSSIMIVEDEPIIALDLHLKLEQMGYQIAAVVRSGEKAVEQAAAKQPDLVLMDINLAGEMDGVEAAAKIQPRWQIPVIYLTASSSNSTLERAKLTAPSAYLLKPFEDRKLETTIPIVLHKHQLEVELRESEGRFRTLVEHAPKAIVVFDADLDRFVDVNGSAEHLFGLEREDLLGIGLREISPPFQPDGRQSGEAIREHIGQALDGGTSVSEWLYKTAAADTVLCENRLVSLPAGGRKLVRASIIDISERQRVERGLIALDRLRALEEMGHGAAHNFNNILACVSGYAELILQDSRDDQITEFSEQILAGTLRARDLVRYLRAAMKGVQHESIQPVQIDELVREVVEATRPRWQGEAQGTGHGIELFTALESTPPIRAAQAGLYDILINLIFNAVDALSGGGNIRIVSRAIEAEVQLTISDTGSGMDERTQQRIFEPFFTTKEDVGSGLGLFTVHETMNRWGGTIKVESELKKGTRFTLCFPIWEGPEKNGGNPQLAVRRSS